MLKVHFLPKNSIIFFESIVFAMGRSSYTKHGYFLFRSYRSREILHLVASVHLCVSGLVFVFDITLKFGAKKDMSLGSTSGPGLAIVCIGKGQSGIQLIPEFAWYFIILLKITALLRIAESQSGLQC